MARRIRYKENHVSFGEFILSDQIRDAVVNVSNDIAAQAAASVPAPHADTDPDRVAAAYHVQRNAGVIKVSGNVRVMVDVYSSDEGAARAEYGGQSGRRYRTLGRTGSRYGDWRAGESGF